MEMCKHICFSSLKFWRSSWYFHPGVDAYEYILGSIKVNLPPQLCWTTHSSRKIPTTKYDTKYWKYPQRNMTQNTENTHNEMWHKIRNIPTTKYDTKNGNTENTYKEIWQNRIFLKQVFQLTQGLFSSMMCLCLNQLFS